MSWLRKVSPSSLYIRKGYKIYPLAPYQLLEILNYQSGKLYNKNWLIITNKPYFKMNNGYKNYNNYIVSLVK